VSQPALTLLVYNLRMKIFRKTIETREATEQAIAAAQKNSDRLWPEVRRIFSRANADIYDEAEAQRAWQIAVITTDTYILGDTRNLSQAETRNVSAALDAYYTGNPMYEYFRGLVVYSMTSFTDVDSGRLYPLVSGLINTMHFGFDAAIEIEKNGDPDEFAATHTALLQNVGAAFAMQLNAWRHVFQDYKVIFAAI